MGQAFAVLLQLFFAPLTGANLAVQGMQVLFRNSEMAHLWAKLKFWIQNGDAHKRVFGCREIPIGGPNGTRNSPHAGLYQL